MLLQHMTVVVEKQGKVWMKALAVLVVSPQNSTHMTRKGHASKVLSCMHLSVMANQIEFQQHGWAILTHMLAMATPTAPGEKVQPSHHLLGLVWAEFGSLGANYIIECWCGVGRVLVAWSRWRQ